LTLRNDGAPFVCQHDTRTACGFPGTQTRVPNVLVDRPLSARDASPGRPAWTPLRCTHAAIIDTLFVRDLGADEIPPGFRRSRQDFLKRFEYERVDQQMIACREIWPPKPCRPDTRRPRRSQRAKPVLRRPATGCPPVRTYHAMSELPHRQVVKDAARTAAATGTRTLPSFKTRPARPGERGRVGHVCTIRIRRSGFRA